MEEMVGKRMLASIFTMRSIRRACFFYYTRKSNPSPRGNRSGGILCLGITSFQRVLGRMILVGFGGSRLGENHICRRPRPSRGVATRP